MSTKSGNNGYQRAASLVVDKKVGGVSMSGYPRTYSVLETFGNYITITSKQLAEMSLPDYNRRMTAFKQYIESIETGITVDISNCRKVNTGVCPINR